MCEVIFAVQTPLIDTAMQIKVPPPGALPAGTICRILTTFPLPYLSEPPCAPTLEPAVGPMGYPLQGCARNPFEDRCVAS